MPPEGIEIVQRSRLREKSGSMEFTETKEVSRRSPQEMKFVRYWSLQNQLNDELMWCLVVFQHNCMPSTFPKVKKSYSWETSSVSKEEVVYLRRHFTQTESHEANITVESPSKWTSTTPVVETSESIEPNDTDLGLNAIGYTFSKIF